MAEIFTLRKVARSTGRSRSGKLFELFKLEFVGTGGEGGGMGLEQLIVTATVTASSLSGTLRGEECLEFLRYASSDTGSTVGTGDDVAHV